MLFLIQQLLLPDQDWQQNHAFQPQIIVDIFDPVEVLLLKSLSFIHKENKDLP